MNFKKLFTLVIVIFFASEVTARLVNVSDGWVRATVSGQQASGAFMTLTAFEDLNLVEVSTPAAQMAELHEMKMDGDIMRMRPVQGGLMLLAGQHIELKPGGFHIMLMMLKKRLIEGERMELMLVFQTKQGQKIEEKVMLPVSLRASKGLQATHSSMTTKK